MNVTAMSAWALAYLNELDAATEHGRMRPKRLLQTARVECRMIFRAYRPIRYVHCVPPVSGALSDPCLSGVHIFAKEVATVR